MIVGYVECECVYVSEKKLMENLNVLRLIHYRSS